MTPVAAGVSGYQLDAYQKTVRLLLMNPVITPNRPDRDALPAVREWAETLRSDLSETLGYRLEIGASHARLVRVFDLLDGSQPATVGTPPRPFDRVRYAYLALALAALGRAGQQVLLSELADAVSDDAHQITHLGFDENSHTARSAFVDAVSWLEDRGILSFRNGSARAWLDNPDQGEALYDIDKDLVAAVYQPSRVVQHISSVDALLHRGSALSRNTRRRDAAVRARRALVEQPVVYYADVDEDMRNNLRTASVQADLERLTGMSLERRREGAALIDTTARGSDLRFPGPGISHVALLLALRIAQRVMDRDEPPLPLIPAATAAERRADSAARIDSGLPRNSVVPADAFTDDLLPDDEPADDAAADADADAAADAAAGRYPLLTSSWLAATIREIDADYGRSLGAAMRADLDKLVLDAVRRLDHLGLVTLVDGGVLAMPLIARYRGASITVRVRNSAGSPAPDDDTLFDLGDPAPPSPPRSRAARTGTARTEEPS